MFSLPNDTEHVYAPLGRCLYCDTKDTLGKEHVIAKSLGGRKILPRASCAKCGTTTSEFERTVARTMLGPMRMHLDIDSSDGALWQSNGPVYVHEVATLTFFTAVSVYAICYLLIRIARPTFSLPEDSRII